MTEQQQEEPSVSNPTQVFKENFYERTGDKSSGQTPNLTVAFYGWQDDE